MVGLIFLGIGGLIAKAVYDEKREEARVERNRVAMEAERIRVAIQEAKRIREAMEAERNRVREQAEKAAEAERIRVAEAVRLRVAEAERIRVVMAVQQEYQAELDIKVEQLTTWLAEKGREWRDCDFVGSDSIVILFNEHDRKIEFFHVAPPEEPIFTPSGQQQGVITRGKINDPFLISITLSSPLGRAIGGHKVGDQVGVNAPAGFYTLIVLKIIYLLDCTILLDQTIVQAHEGELVAQSTPGGKRIFIFIPSADATTEEGNA